MWGDRYERYLQRSTTACAIKTANRIDENKQAKIESNASKLTARSTGSTSKEIQRQYQEDLERRRRAIAAATRAAQEENIQQARRTASLNMSGGTNPLMFG